jgi:hypothetical protein
MDEKNSKYLPLNLQAVFMVLSIFIITSAAMANTIIQKQDFNGILNFSRILTFNKYNTSETLTSVSISLNLRIKGGTLIIDNDGDSSVSGTLKFGISGNVNSTEVNLPISLLSTKLCYSQAFNLDSNTGDGKGDYDPSPTDGMQFTGSNNSGDVPAFVENTFWNDYIGTGTYNVAVSIISLVDYGNFDDIEYAITTPVSTNGYIEVVYTCIPEPATITLLTFGVLAVPKRKRKK